MSMLPKFALTTALFTCVSLQSYGEAIMTDCEKDKHKKNVFGAECGVLEVALHSSLENPRIKIHFVRIPAISQSNKPPIFFIQGGPGGASSDLANTFRNQFRDLLTQHDFIFVDQRGTGKSNALNCDIDPLENAHQSVEQQEQIHFETHKTCMGSYSADPSFFTTIDAVTDLEKIRQALAYDKIFLWGGSYGTRVILEYLRSFAGSIEGAILDGLAPIEIQLPRYFARDTNRAFKKLLSQCEKDAFCSKAFPELKKKWLSLLSALKKNPVHVDIKHPRSETSQQVFVDDLILSGWVRAALYSRNLSTLLPLALSKAVNNDFSMLYGMHAIGFGDVAKSISEGMQLAVLCAEDAEYAKRNPIDNIDDNALLHIPNARSFDEICGLFPPSRVPESYFQPGPSHVPSLLLSGDLDPVTPPKWAQVVKKRLLNSQHIVVAGGHHGVSGLGCLPKIIGEFIATPNNVGDIDSTCVNKIVPRKFFIDGAGPYLRSQTSADVFNEQRINNGDRVQ